MNRIIFNPDYIVKPDKGRALLMHSSDARVNGMVGNGSEFIIHPIHASILNSLTGNDLSCSVNEVASMLHVSSQLVEKFIFSLLDKKDFIRIKGTQQGPGYLFPPYTILSTDKSQSRAKIMPDSFFNGKTDIRRKRHYTPTNITLMLNNKCVTDCFYCYADKRNPTDCSIPFERLEKLVEEARAIHVNNFDVIGGEFFLYKDWDKLLSLLHQYDYHPYLSTKVPLDEPIIKRLSELKITSLQFSLDTLICSNLCAMLHVGQSYLEKVKKMFGLLQDYGIKIYVHTILTSKNDSIEDVSSVYEFISRFGNISYWKLDIATPSLYKKEQYATIRPDDEKIQIIATYLEAWKSKSEFPILYNNRLNTYFTRMNHEDKAKAFKNRATCSANYSGFFILPDGNVTICEELYWNDNFLIGDVTKQGLLDVWNSDKAMKLYHLSQAKIGKDSKCSRCAVFDACRQDKGVCWKAIIGAYGEEKWYYPDPLCTL